MSSAYYGVNLFWGLGPTTVTVTNATGIYQDADYSTPVEKKEERDQRGAFIAVNYYNTIEKLSLTWLASDANSASGSAGISYPNVGTQVSITSAQPFSGSLWKVDSHSETSTNTSNMVVKCELTRYAGF